MKFSYSHAILIVSFVACAGGAMDACTNGQCDIGSNTVGVSDDEVAMLQISKITNNRQTAGSEEKEAEEAEAIEEEEGTDEKEDTKQYEDAEHDAAEKESEDAVEGEKSLLQRSGKVDDAAVANITANITGVSVEEVKGIGGYVAFTGDCAGNDLSALEDKSAAECAAACTCDDSCKGFSYLPGTWKYRCVHKSASCNSPSPNGWTFYMKSSVTKEASMPRVMKSTPTNSEGNGNALYLDRHNLDCGADGFISSIKYARQGGGKMRFDYSCASLPSDLMGTCTVRHSNTNDDGNGDARYLDRHNVKCEAGELMTQVKLARQGNHKYRYRYTCCSVKGGFQGCAQTTTLANADGKGDARYLDRHNLVCPEGKAMKRFKMNRQGGSKYRYDYTCCSVSKCV